MTDTNDTERIISYLLSSGCVAYQRGLARAVGDHSAGLLLSQMWYWSERQPAERDGWFFMTQEQIEDELVMHRKEQESSRRRLRALGVLEEARRGVPAKLWFRINRPAVVKMLQQHVRGKTEKESFQYAQTVHTRMPVLDIQDSPSRADKSAQTGHTFTKTSSKTTTKITTQPLPQTKNDVVVAVAALVEDLIAAGLGKADARRLAQAHPDECRRQLAFLPFIAAFRSSKGAYLRAAIEQEYGPPKGYEEAQKTARRTAKARQQTQDQQDVEAAHSAEKATLAALRARAQSDPALWEELVQEATRTLPKILRDHPHSPAYQETLQAGINALLALREHPSAGAS